MAATLTKTLALFVLLWATGSCEVRDLSGKQFTFPNDPQGVNQPHVALHVQTKSISIMTVCLRFFSQLNRMQGLFSLATVDHQNALMLNKDNAGSYKVHTGSESYVYLKLPTNQLDWNSVCWTWDSGTGLTQLWLNGLRTSQKLVGKNYPVKGELSIIIGQEQDEFKGGFKTDDSFEGDICDLHMWDHIVSACDIRSYMNQGSFSPGNLLNWNNLNHTVSGNVFIQDADFEEPVCQ
ncbi:C-reactive protein-like [Toxotes jaculatrix]|uniref:C-reactive protein-like n=1 Tax=Toxotes jaculatrix TaxID=941984 RepID=UPI001B3B0D62|nr:C-reactive protein-like [Toxotes jaculatrix]XP_040921156.1 C-reactive protein-like [Toxotes jaculatrix]